jgi:cation transport ATPase
VRKRPFQLTPRHKRWLYLIASVLFLSGTLWWLADIASERQWPGANLTHASKPFLLKIHGGFAMAFLFMLGTLWPNHIRRAWQAGQNRRSGVTLLAWLAALTATGYGLYYLGDEHLREWTAKAHDALGGLALVVLLAHVWLGRRSQAKAIRFRN